MNEIKAQYYLNMQAVKNRASANIPPRAVNRRFVQVPVTYRILQILFLLALATPAL